MKVIGYVCGTDKQNIEKQKYLLDQYAQGNQMPIDEFIYAEISSWEDIKERRISELLSKLTKGDILLVAELSQLGRNMLQTLNIINSLGEQGVQITFVLQPELSTSGHQAELLFIIYRYLEEMEQGYISEHNK